MRKINESMLSSPLKIDVVSLSSEFPEISIDKLANELSNNLGVNISKEEEDGTVYMIIDDTDYETTIDEIADIIYTETDVEDLDKIKSIIQNCIIEGDNLDYEDDDDYPSYDEFDEDYPVHENLTDDIYDTDDIDKYHKYHDYYPSYDECDDDECDDDECDELTDDELQEDEEFECYESKKYRYIGNGIYESKKGCCPKRKSPRRMKKMVNLSEALSSKKLSVRDVVKSAKKNNKPVKILTESIINRAIKKAKNNKRNELKESLGADKYNLVVKAMKSGKKYLYENKKINGKSLAKYSSKELYKFLKEIQEQYNKLNKKLNGLNESASLKQEIELNEKIQNKLRLINILDEELTYRLTIKRLLEDEDMDNALEPLSVDPNDENKDAAAEGTEDSEENPEEDEEVELSRVVITVANQEAADELKASMIDAGIPEDAIEFETEDDEETEDEESEDTEETEETEETEGEAKESLYYNKFKKLLEDDGDDDAEETDDTEGGEDDTEGDGDAEDGDDDAEDDETVKVVLTNTDYIQDLADVLNNEYGISKDEFEESIGGEIIEDENSEDESDEESEENEDKKDDKESSSGDDAVDAMTPEDLDKLFGNA